MVDYLITEAEVSDDDFQEKEVIEPMNKEGLEFINNENDGEQDEVDFYQTVDKKIFLEQGGEIPVPVLKHGGVKLNIESDSESECEEE